MKSWLDRKALFLSTASALAFVVLPTQANAQSAANDTRSSSAEQKASAGPGIDDIIVTARRREESLQNVPQAISVLTADELTTQQVRDQNDLQQKVPSLSVAGRFGATNGNYAIRGLAGSVTGNAAVGTYFAEVPSPTTASGGDLSAGQTLYDIASVQVLKGPQGTLFGRTTVAGAVLVTPAAPNLNEWEANASLSMGNRAYSSGTVAVSVPLIKDMLAVRFAGNFNNREGYTRIIGSDRRLNGLGNDAQRVSVLFQPVSWFKNTTIYDRFHSDQTSSSYVLVDARTTAPQLNLPAAALTPACTTAVANGLSPSVDACIAQRQAILADIRASLVAEDARTARGGSSLRETNAGNTSSFREETLHETLVNTTTLDLPEFGGVDLQLKNIFGYQFTKGYFNLNNGGVPLDLVLLNFGSGAGAAFNQVGNTATRALGKGNKFYTNETQLSGTLFDHLDFVVGYYYQRAPYTPDLVNLGAMQKLLGGVTTPNLGYVQSNSFQTGGRAKQTAYYAQGTFKFDGLIDGLSFTAGYRRSKDDNRLLQAAAVLNPVTGVYSPGARSTTITRSEGTNYTFSLDYKATPDLLLYITHRKGYAPGGLNAANAPVPIFGPESIKDVEAGFKWDFDLGGTRGRLNMAAYQMDYSDIQKRTTTVTVPLISYTDNVANGRLRGIEMELLVLPTDNLKIGVNYSYNDAKYKTWIGADPYSVVPGRIDLSDDDFENAPKHKLNVNATYDIPLSGDNGVVALTGQVTYQSRIFFATAVKRYLRNYGGSVDNISQAPFALVTARIDWRDPLGHEGVTASLFARNLFDKIYAFGGTQLSGLGSVTKQFAEPRIIGASVSFEF